MEKTVTEMVTGCLWALLKLGHMVFIYSVILFWSNGLHTLFRCIQIPTVTVSDSDSGSARDRSCSGTCRGLANISRNRHMFLVIDENMRLYL